MQVKIVDLLWGHKAKLNYLLMAACLLLFFLLGAREIWTQEHRWADIVAGMFYRQDFLHPYLGKNFYYDKPLLSYWLIICFAKLSGSLTTWALRLPSALAGLLAIWSIYRIGFQLKNRQLGMLAGWLLLTTFYFLFWARTSSADMLNLGGSLFAIAWYFDHRRQAGLFDYSVFFLIIALTSLCKGLVGAIIPFIAVFTDIVLQGTWRRHFSSSMFLSLLPAVVIYLIPFIASSYYSNGSYGQNGLYLVYRENILRYFEPFDHKGPIYTYLIFLPIYLLPWTFLFIPALLALPSRWKTLTLNSKWIIWTTCALFLFFTLSGSRRSYYVLPIVPFAILLTADWLISLNDHYIKIKQISGYSILLVAILLFVAVDVVPAIYYAKFGINQFAEKVKTQAEKIMPWSEWQVVSLDGESKLNFYLQLPPTSRRFSISGNRSKQTQSMLIKDWPILQNKPKNTIFITRKLYVPMIEPYLKNYRIVELTNSKMAFFKDKRIDTPVAFIPT